MHHNNNQMNFQKKKLFSKNLLLYNFHKIENKNKMKIYTQVSRKFDNKYLKKMK